ncbi:TonB-dependent receptor [Flavobacterium sp. W21_SRS_FM6]|uniref:TonB-dependent receptor n=1 Tax=Flavobacterium sp. W21_SRS_FM6 TaxID=3240268 RepID=UPI003F91CA08
MATKITRSQAPTFRKSLLALAMMSVCATTYAQEAAPQESEEDVELIEVTGTRTNLLNAQNLKRSSETVVDSITAADIGSLPDRSVLEAIQRLPGVSIELFDGPSDPDHFSVEGSGAIIRGMTQTRSEFNGRDSFSADSSRGLSFQDVSPELMGGVDIFKNQTADMIEGGIGGTINLRTRKPFDSREQVVALSGDYSYGSLAEKGSPTLSGLYSNQWELDSGGRFGFLANYAHSKLYGQSHGIQSDAAVQFYARDIAGAEAFVGEDGNGTVWAPQAGNALKKSDDRTREGFSTALQYANEDDTFQSTLQYIRSDSNLTWHEQAIKYQGGYFSINNRRTRPLSGTEFTFDDRGVFESGTFSDGGVDGWRAADGNQDRIPRTWGTNSRQDFPHIFQFDSRIQDSSSLVEDLSLNLEWSPSENLDLSADFQHIKAKSSNDDVVVHTGTNAGQIYDVTGSTPTLSLVEPWYGYRDANPELFAAGTAPENANNPDRIYPGFTNDPAGDSNYFSEYDNYMLRSAMDHYERSEGDSNAIRFDGTYHLEDEGLFTSIQAGVRYAKRDQTVRRTSYNWNGLAPNYSSGTGWLTSIDGYQNDFELVDWSDFHGGDVLTIQGNQTIHATEAYVRSIMGANPARQPYTSNASGWNSYPNQNGVSDSEFGLFSPGDVNNTIETNKAIYVRVNFEGNDDLRYSGNFGLRYVTLNRESKGFINFPDLTPDSPVPEGVPEQLTNEFVRGYITQQVNDGVYADADAFLDDEANRWVSDGINYLSAEDRQWGNNYDDVLNSEADFNLLLPSFNIKVELTDELIARFAFSKAAAFPDLQDVRNQTTLGADVFTVRPTVDPEADPDTVDPLDGLIQDAFVIGRTGSGGFTGLKPMESVQYDIALEWYFADVGQLSATIFHKNLKNYFIKGASPQTYTNPSTGRTETSLVSSTVNGSKGKMDGLEVAYQQFFDDFVPGFGIQATYSYIDASGTPNNEESYDEASWINSDYNDTGIRVNFDAVPLQGQSKETINFIAMYEKDEISARIAYNWRSKYLLTTRDVISKAPLWNDDRGQVDASFFYNFENYTVGIQGTNLTNSTSKTIMILNDELLETGRSWFVSDRRVALVFRANF